MDAADEALFQQALTNRKHVFASLLLNKSRSHYHLRPRRHDRLTSFVRKCNQMFALLLQNYSSLFLVYVVLA